MRFIELVTHSLRWPVYDTVLCKQHATLYVNETHSTELTNIDIAQEHQTGIPQSTFCTLNDREINEFFCRR